MSIYEHFEHAQNSALHEIRTLVLICQPWIVDVRIYTYCYDVRIYKYCTYTQYLYIVLYSVSRFIFITSKINLFFAALYICLIHRYIRYRYTIYFTMKKKKVTIKEKGRENYDVLYLCI